MGDLTEGVVAGRLFVCLNTPFCNTEKTPESHKDSNVGDERCEVPQTGFDGFDGCGGGGDVDDNVLFGFGGGEVEAFEDTDECEHRVAGSHETFVGAGGG